MTGKLSCNIKYLILSLLAVAGVSTSIFAQPSNIGGIINQYGRVDSVGTDHVIVSDPVQWAYFQPGNYVLLIQMKGVRMSVLEDNSFGSGANYYGEPGKHEFLVIESVELATKMITFTADLNTAFDKGSYVQLIKVPYYNNALVTAKLECTQWESTNGTGGVLAAIVGNTLSLNENIDVTGKGFKGGAVSTGKGICITDNEPKWYKYAYSALSDSAGFKGEGLAIMGDTGGLPYVRLYPEFGKGRGANFSGGGGGNGKYSGGGGGANIGTGGRGGREMSDVCTGKAGGEPGKTIPISGLFLGGGGGASTYITAGATAGGNGGGIIILICDTLKGNGYSILAEGGTPLVTASGTAGAGGGGGGGSVAIYLQSFSTKTASSALSVKAGGGKGGNNLGQTFGEGGGGGGGLITTNTISSVPPNVNKSNPTGGAAGTKSGVVLLAQPGGNGLTELTFKPVLNGFLFNSIRSSANGNEVDSICSNVTPKPITGTIPIGTGDFTYLWQISYNLSGPASEISGEISKDLTFSAPETNTFWVRRVVTDNSAVPVIIDTSKWVNIIVQPAITGNLIGKDTTICYNQNPLALTGAGTPAGGYGKINYHWLQNNLNNWPLHVNAEGPDSTKADFDPSALTQTTFYKRKVTSGHCVDYSSTVTITVLQSITGNVTLKPDSVICEGSLFNVLGASPAGKGAGPGSYDYQWQDSTATNKWQPAAGLNTDTIYTPDTLQFATIEQRYFRRVVYSGPDSVCRSNSIPIRMTRWHKIENNTIASPDNMICSGDTPIPLIGNTPVNGDWTYTYQWQDSSKTVTWTTQFTSGTPYPPPALTDTTWYRRIVNSSVCTNTSNKIFINVHDPITNYNIAGDTTICSGAIPQKLRGEKASGGNGSFAYQWYYSDNSSFTPKIPVPVTGTVEDFTPVALTRDTYYMREVTSGECFEVSNIIKVTVLPVISNNIITPAKATVCFNTVPGQITGSALTGGAGGTPIWIWEQSTNGSTWIAAAGTNDQQNYSPPNPQKVKMWYRRIILSGQNNCCIDTSLAATLDIDPLPTGTINNLSDTTICNGSQVQLNVHLTGAANWTIVYLENTTQVTANNIGTANVLINRVPSASASLSTFNYSLFSVQDNNGCFATSLTGTKKADVYRIPNADAGPDDEICGPEYTFAAIRSDGNGTWTWEPAAPVLVPYPAAYNGKVIIDSSFTAPEVSFKFYWEEKNWLCVDKDSVTVTFYNRIDTISAGADTAIFTFDFRTKLNAYPIKSYEAGLWSVVNGKGDFESDNVNSTFVKNMAAGLNTYKWRVTNNGFCPLEDLINIDVASAVIPEGISPDGDLINDTLTIKGLNLEDQVVDLTIINGAGTQIFKTSNRDGKNNWTSWNGKNSKGTELPEGTYYYLLKVESPNTGIVMQKSGFIILKRH
ncbi:MAG: gliding motility-associated C-terminal domain-containing protein [Bacteroidales bacterium]|jgi:hypothetical protein|nr:gliding motility-associated C-terminal domain-containing protein [Bacteroidales bacterium]